MSIIGGHMTRLILASSSPRRKEILNNAGIPYKAISPDADEAFIGGYSPEDFVQELARKKALSVIQSATEDDIIIGVDTIVLIEGNMLGKPCKKEDAKKMMHLLSGKTHYVISGVCILKTSGFEKVFYNKTKVEFLDLTDEEIEEYIQTDEPYDKAGGYAIQGLASKFIKGINGCYYNVMGLPLSAVYSVIKEML